MRAKPRGKLQWLMFIVFVIAVAPLVADAVNGYIKPIHGCRSVTVIDGDTVKATCPVTGYETARLIGFDTPEFKARCPSELFRAVGATYYLRYLLYTSDKIVATPRETDRYGRRLVMLTLDGTAASHAMIAAGLARANHGEARQSWCM